MGVVINIVCGCYLNTQYQLRNPTLSNVKHPLVFVTCPIHGYVQQCCFQVERLMELHFKHLDKVRQCDDDIEREKLVSCQHGPGGM